jgi:hypothetical protein
MNKSFLFLTFGALAAGCAKEGSQQAAPLAAPTPPAAQAMAPVHVGAPGSVANVGPAPGAAPAQSTTAAAKGPDDKPVVAPTKATKPAKHLSRAK